MNYQQAKAHAREMRKHIVNYVKGIPGAAQLRAKLASLDSYAQAEDMVNEVVLGLR